MLRKKRHEWTMEFVDSGEAALAYLATTPVDVVVSDMRMPGMDGPALLKRVHDSYPSTTRLILSGQADPDSIARALSVTQQFLTKPCTPDLLRTTLERIAKLRALLSNPAIQRLVGKMKELPSVPALYSEFCEMVQDETKGAADVAALIQRDPAIAAKVLQIINGAWFGNGKAVSSVQNAVALLGVNFLRMLVLNSTVFSAGQAIVGDASWIKSLQEHALKVGTVLKHLAPDGVQAEEWFVAGLLHDVGKLVLRLSSPERYANAERECRRACGSIEIFEVKFFGVSSDLVGAYLLGTWGLPTRILEAVAHRCAPEDILEGDRELAVALHIVDRLASQVDSDPDAATVLDLTQFPESRVHGSMPEIQALLAA